NAKFVFLGMGIGAVTQWIKGGFAIFSGVIQLILKKPLHLSVGMELSPIMLGVGFLVGPAIALTALSGALTRGIILTPVLHLIYNGTPAENEIAFYIRMIGAGGVAAGGLISIIKVFPLIIQSFKGSLSGLRESKSAADTGSRLEQDLSFKWILVVIIGALALTLISMPTKSSLQTQQANSLTRLLDRNREIQKEVNGLSLLETNANSTVMIKQLAREKQVLIKEESGNKTMVKEARD
ncbi:unnamed protein product, partial [marine sediment metagenome]